MLWFAEIGPIYEANSPGLVEALNANEVKLADNSTMLLAMRLRELYTNDCFGPDALSNEFANTESVIASGEYAMTVNRLGLPAQIESAYPEVSADTFGFFVIPSPIIRSGMLILPHRANSSILVLNILMQPRLTLNS